MAWCLGMWVWLARGIISFLGFSIPIKTKKWSSKGGQSGLKANQQDVAHSCDTNFTHLKATEDSDPLWWRKAGWLNYSLGFGWGARSCALPLGLFWKAAVKALVYNLKERVRGSQSKKRRTGLYSSSNGGDQRYTKSWREENPKVSWNVFGWTF